MEGVAEPYFNNGSRFCGEVGVLQSMSRTASGVLSLALELLPIQTFIIGVRRGRIFANC